MRQLIRIYGGGNRPATDPQAALAKSIRNAVLDAVNRRSDISLAGYAYSCNNQLLLSVDDGAACHEDADATVSGRLGVIATLPGGITVFLTGQLGRALSGNLPYGTGAGGAASTSLSSSPRTISPGTQGGVLSDPYSYQPPGMDEPVIEEALGDPEILEESDLDLAGEGSVQAYYLAFDFFAVGSALYGEAGGWSPHIISGPDFSFVVGGDRALRRGVTAYARGGYTDTVGVPATTGTLGNEFFAGGQHDTDYSGAGLARRWGVFSFASSVVTSPYPGAGLGWIASLDHEAAGAISSLATGLAPPVSPPPVCGPDRAHILGKHSGTVSLLSWTSIHGTPVYAHVAWTQISSSFPAWPSAYLLATPYTAAGPVFGVTKDTGSAILVAVYASPYDAVSCYLETAALHTASPLYSVGAVACNADGAEVVYANQHDNQLEFWSSPYTARTADATVSLPSGYQLYWDSTYADQCSLAYLADGRLLVSAHDASDNTFILVFEGHAFTYALPLTYYGDPIPVSGGGLMWAAGPDPRVIHQSAAGFLYPIEANPDDLASYPGARYAHYGANWKIDTNTGVLSADMTSEIESIDGPERTITLHVTTSGSGAPRAVFSVSIPEGYSFVSASEPGVHASGTVTWDVSDPGFTEDETRDYTITIERIR